MRRPLPAPLPTVIASNFSLISVGVTRASGLRLFRTTAGSKALQFFEGKLRAEVLQVGSNFRICFTGILIDVMWE